MNKVLVSLLLTLGITGMAHAAGDPAAGQEKAAVCGACHGADGNSPAPNFPKLAGQGERYLLKQLHDIKAGSKPGAPADAGRMVPEMTGMLEPFNDQDLADLAAYFASQKMSVGMAEPDLVAQGEALYRGGKLELGIASHRLPFPARRRQRPGRLPAARRPARRLRDQAADRLPRRQPYQRRRCHDHAQHRRQAQQQGHRGGVELHPGPALIQPRSA